MSVLLFFFLSDSIYCLSDSMRIYLDACCLNRPFDDLSIDRNRFESEAVISILEHVRNKRWEWVSSSALTIELEQAPSSSKKQQVREFLNLVKSIVVISSKELVRRKELTAMGFKSYDAYHIAAAESGACDILLTTDDAMI